MDKTEDRLEQARLGPGDPEWCPNAPTDDPGHCGHWSDCEPCCRCGDDTRDPRCDCEKCAAARTERLIAYIKTVDMYFNEHGWQSHALLSARRAIADILDRRRVRP